MTVLCLIEQADDGGVADVSLRALTFARTLAASAPEPGQSESWMYQRAASDPSNSTFMADDRGGGAGATPTDVVDGAGGAGGVADGVGGVAAVVFGDAAVPVSALSEYGVAGAYAVELTGYAPQAWARALAGLAAELSATAVVAAGTDHGSEVMAHLGAITGLPMAANCVSAGRTAGGVFELVRHRWAGSLLEDAVLDATPALLTVAVDAVAAAPADEPAATAVHAFRPALDDADLLVRATESAERSAGVSLATARVVVGGGRGVGGPDGFGVLEELAGLLGGVVGVSRVVTSEGWRPHKQQVGQTGTRISPELYLACGISGAIQHMAGCLSAKHIVAVNTDPDAPIISHADYAVIGDLNQVLPALVDAIRARSS
jgi:electron transfer flavoprotein alpha subunit